MATRVLSLFHDDDARSGVFAEAAAAAGWQLDEHPAAAGEPPDLAPYAALIVLGGDANVDQEDIHPWLVPEKAFLRAVLDRGFPVLGICLGSQLLAAVAGAPVGPLAHPEIGWVEVDLTPAGAEDPVVGSMPSRFLAAQWHAYGAGLPPGGVALATGEAGLQAYRLGESAWGLQFHAEVTEDTLDDWIDHYGDGPAARAARLDPEAFRRETSRHIERWSACGREMCTRFLDVAAHLTTRSR
jgi:GMP synthase-like glutamine amidotransferase